MTISFVQANGSLDRNLEDLVKSYYLEEGKKLEKRWMNCMELKGHQVEKLNVFFLKNMCFIQKDTHLLTHPVIRKFPLT